MSKLAIVLLSLLGLWALAGCPAGSDGEPGSDGPVAGDQGQKDAAVPDAPKEPDLPPMTSYKVAAIQYAEGQYGQVQGCTDDVCALSKLAEEAAIAGARLVVTPEYATGQEYSEPAPKVGDNPVTDARWEEGTIIKSLARVADVLNITLVFHVITDEGDKLYGTGLAVDRYGVVVARHYKFQLYGEKGLTPGANLDTSFFDTPAGKTGILICADVQCAVVGGVYEPTCTASALGLLKAFIAQKPALIVFSAHWMVGPTNSTSNWWPVNVQKTMAKTAKSYLMAANVTEGPGIGGGIYNPDGTEIATVTSSKPVVVYGELPLKK
jgi:predicted amidohydrolase